MTKPKLTEWIRCVDQQPTIPGWYDVKYHGWGDEVYRRLWFTGWYWLNSDLTASIFGNYGLEWENDSWRGLAEDPNKCK